MVYLRCGELEIDWGKNHGFADHRPLFQSTDISTANYRYVDDDGSDVVVEREALVRPLHLVAPRLRLLGTSSATAAKDCVAGVLEHDYLHEGISPPTPDEVLAAFASLRVEDLHEESWLSPRLVVAPHAIPDEGHRGRIEAALQHVTSWDLLALLALNKANDDQAVVWEYADVLEGGWMQESWLRAPLPTVNQFLIVGEGTSDTRIMKATLDLLRPEVADFFYFVDMEAGYPFTGTGNVLRFCQGLVSMRLLNRVLFVLDNDAEGVATCARIERLGLPLNMAAMVLPAMATFESFATIGPSGEHVEDINGRAVSIECFLDLVHGGSGTPRVRWTSYHLESRTYQGSLEHKDGYKTHFLDQASGRNPSYDFRKLEHLLDLIIAECCVVAERTKREDGEP